MRKNRPGQEDPSSEEEQVDTEPDRIAAENEEHALVWDALATLPENYRLPLILYYREDQSVARVAESLNLSPDAVKQRLARGRAMLRDQVMDLVEGSLVRNRPTAAFTVAVISALPGFVATSTAAAAIGTAGKTGIGAGSAAVASSGAMLGMLGGLLGGLFGGLGGWWAGDQTARYQKQRELLKKRMTRMLVFLTIFQIPWVTLWLGWWNPDDLGTGGYLVFQAVWMAGFFTLIGKASWRIGKESRRIQEECRTAGAEELPTTRLRRRLREWEGRCWESRARFLGWPLVSVAFSDPDPDFTGHRPEDRNASRVAKGWIALGDRATGLFAFGNIAVGGVAIGAVACGLVSFGGVALGGVAIGGLALAALGFGGFAAGGGALGGVAAGWLAFGGVAVAWKGAMGGVAVAHDYAVGGSAFGGIESNTEAAKGAVETHPFFQLGEAAMMVIQQPWFVPAGLALVFGSIAGLLAVGYRKRKTASEETFAM